MSIYVIKKESIMTPFPTKVAIKMSKTLLENELAD